MSTLHVPPSGAAAGSPGGDRLRQAVTWLHEVDDIEDFATKVSRTPVGFLRTSCKSHLRRLFNLTNEESDQAIDTFLGKEASCGAEPSPPASGSDV